MQVGLRRSLAREHDENGGRRHKISPCDAMCKSVFDVARYISRATSGRLIVKLVPLSMDDALACPP